LKQHEKQSALLRELADVDFGSHGDGRGATGSDSDEDYDCSSVVLQSELSFEQQMMGDLPPLVPSSEQLTTPARGTISHNIAAESRGETLVESYVKAITVRETYDKEKLEQYKDQLLKRVVAKIQLKQRLHNETVKRSEGVDTALFVESQESTLDTWGQEERVQSLHDLETNSPCPSVSAKRAYKPVVSSAEAISILKRKLDLPEKDREQEEAGSRPPSSTSGDIANQNSVDVNNSRQTSNSVSRQPTQRLSDEKLTDIRKRVVHLTHVQAVTENKVDLDARKLKSQARLGARLSERKNVIPDTRELTDTNLT
jgi:hypothetical protein